MKDMRGRGNSCEDEEGVYVILFIIRTSITGKILKMGVALLFICKSLSPIKKIKALSRKLQLLQSFPPVKIAQKQAFELNWF